MEGPLHIPTEPIGSIPRPAELIAARTAFQAGRMPVDEFNGIAGRALLDTIRLFEQSGSPVITDGEQTKSSFATYPLEGLTNLAPDGVIIPFEDGHTRQLRRLSLWTVPLRYASVDLPGGCQAPDQSAGKAGGDLGIGSQPALSGFGNSGVLARGFPIRPGARSRRRLSRLPGTGRR